MFVPPARFGGFRVETTQNTDVHTSRPAWHVVCSIVAEMKRSIRRLIGCPVSLPGRALGTVRTLYVCLTQWSVRHIEIVFMDGVRLTTRSDSVIHCAGSTPCLTISLRGTFDRKGRLSIGESSSPTELSAERLMSYGLDTSDGTSYLVTDLVVDERTWDVDFLVVATGEGGAAAVPTADIHSVDRSRRRLSVLRSRVAYEG